MKKNYFQNFKRYEIQIKTSNMLNSNIKFAKAIKKY